MPAAFLEGKPKQIKIKQYIFSTGLQEDLFKIDVKVVISCEKSLKNCALHIFIPNPVNNGNPREKSSKI